MSQCYYEILQTKSEPELKGLWDGPAWAQVPDLSIDRFHVRSGSHRPRTHAKLQYDKRGLHVLFKVDDRFVRCVYQGYQQPTCRDSCVEFFVEPLLGRGYFNFEVNCGGALLVYHITDPTSKPGGGFTASTVLAEKLLEQVAIYHSLPEKIEPEMIDPVAWQVEMSIPWDFFATVLGPITPSPGTSWRANFYKCGDATSHPHWASWSPIEEVLNFHKPSCFGTIQFGGGGAA